MLHNLLPLLSCFCFVIGTSYNLLQQTCTKRIYTFTFIETVNTFVRYSYLSLSMFIVFYNSRPVF